MKNELKKKLDLWIESEKSSRAAFYFGCDAQKMIYETAKNILDKIQNFDNLKFELDTLIKSKDHFYILDEISRDLDFCEFQKQVELVLKKHGRTDTIDDDYKITVRACDKILEFA